MIFLDHNHINEADNSCEEECQLICYICTAFIQCLKNTVICICPCCIQKAICKRQCQSQPTLCILIISCFLTLLAKLIILFGLNNTQADYSDAYKNNCNQYCLMLCIKLSGYQRCYCYKCAGCITSVIEPIYNKDTGKYVQIT